MPALLSDIVMENTGWLGKKKKKGKKGTQFRKEKEQLSVFAHGMLLYGENVKKQYTHTHKIKQLLEIINPGYKLYKFIIQKINCIPIYQQWKIHKWK